MSPNARVDQSTFKPLLWTGAPVPFTTRLGPYASTLVLNIYCCYKLLFCCVKSKNIDRALDDNIVNE